MFYHSTESRTGKCTHNVSNKKIDDVDSDRNETSWHFYTQRLQ